jgi:hypothetical protein
MGSSGVEVFGRPAHCPLLLDLAIAGVMAVVTASAISSCTEKNVGEVAVVTLGPDMLAGLRLDQLCSDAESVAGLAQAAFEHVTHAQFAPDLFHIDRAARGSEGRVGGDHKQ